MKTEVKDLEFASVKELADGILNAMETAERDRGDKFYRLKEECAKAYMPIIRYLHDDMLPDDWRYELIVRVCQTVSDFETDALEPLDDPLFEPDVYWSALASWVYRGSTSAHYCEQYMKEFGPNFESFEMILQGGQMKEMEEIYRLMQEYVAR